MGSRRPFRRWRRRLLLLAAVVALALLAWLLARWLAASTGGFGPDVAAKVPGGLERRSSADRDPDHAMDRL